MNNPHAWVQQMEGVWIQAKDQPAMPLIVPPPPLKRARRGDSGSAGLRTVRNGIIRWRGHDFAPCASLFEPPYNGEYEGLRFIVQARYEHGGIGFQASQILFLHHPYDGPIEVGIPFIRWRRWVRADVFDD